MSFRRVVILLLPFLAAGCASAPETAPPPEASRAKLMAASPEGPDPLRPSDDLLDATSAADKVLGCMIQYAKVRALDVEPLRATLESFRKDLVQHLRRETISSIWLDVPGHDGLAWERFEITLSYRRGLAGYRVNDKLLSSLADAPKLPPDTRKTEVWFRASDNKPTTPARALHPAAQRIQLGRIFDSGSISGEARAWLSVEVVQN